MVPIALLVFSGTVLGVMGIQITNMRVPKAVKHNLYSPVVLDCDYTLTQEEKNADSYGGLVVKWYLNNFDSPVYQWIPGKKPQDLGALKGRLDVNYRASDNPATMHRALYIRNPTTDLSGDYKCLVSTFNDEDFMVKRMVVYATQKVLQMEQTKPTPEMLNLTCKATSVYPEPKMTLYKDPDSKSTGSSLLEGVTVKVIPQHTSYDIVAWKVMDEMELPTVFACQLSIPDTDYVVRKSFVYYPGIFQSSVDSGVACSSISYYWMSLLLLLVSHFFC